MEPFIALIVLPWLSILILCVMKILRLWLTTYLQHYAARTEAIRDNWEPRQNQ